MARDRPDRPLTDEEIAALREEMDEQRNEIRTYLASEGVDVDAWEDESTRPRADGGE